MDKITDSKSNLYHQTLYQEQEVTSQEQVCVGLSKKMAG